MIQTNVIDLASHLPEYINQAAAGEMVLVYKDNEPIAEIIPYHKKKKKESELRPFGLCKGQIKVADDFDAPLPDEITNLFYS